MGLDMYLYKRTFVSKYPDLGLAQSKLSEMKGINRERVRYIIEEVAYWRKANQIHAWFVKNVQGGKDDCGDYEVSTEQLGDLVQLCRKVLAETELIPGQVANGYRYENGKEIAVLEPGRIAKDSSVAKKLLPAKSGFFFGSTDYDNYYFDDLEQTIKMLVPLLTEPNADYYYHSSW